MKITQTYSYFYTPELNKKSKKPLCSDLNTVNNNMLSNVYYPVAFNGGKSMNLAETAKQIDQSGEYPAGIRENVQSVIDKGNPDALTLIDIHKDKYCALQLCETLDEAKELYPEFKDVLSDIQVNSNKNSFVEQVKSGLVKGFDPDTDVALQLLQLYWGEGFSLNTLKNDYADKNISYCFEKLNIPRVNKVYGQYLKLSDKEYNSRYTKTISERAAEFERKKVEKEEGIYIPRGPLSDEHKAKISEGLKKFYAQHPERLNEMSLRQLNFYEQNPEEYEKLSQIMLRAWNYHEAAPVRKKLAKSLKKASLSQDDILNGFKPDHAVNLAFKEFWKKNQWAKQILSDCVKKSWTRQRELEEIGLIREPDATLKIIPDLIKKEIVKYAEYQMPDIANYIDNVFYFDGEQSVNDKYKLKSLQALKIRDEFFNKDPAAEYFTGISNCIAVFTALSKIYNIYNRSDGKSCPGFPKIYHEFIKVFRKEYKENNLISSELYKKTLKTCLDVHDLNSFKIMQECLEKSSKKIQDMNFNSEKTASYYDTCVKNLSETVPRKFDL